MIRDFTFLYALCGRLTEGSIMRHGLDVERHVLTVRHGNIIQEGVHDEVAGVPVLRTQLVDVGKREVAPLLFEVRLTNIYRLIRWILLPHRDDTASCPTCGVSDW